MKKTSLIVIGIAILIIIGIFLFGGKNNKTESVATITGSVMYLERMALPENSTVTVILQDISKTDIAAEKIAEQVIATEGKQVPIPFSISYDANKIKPANTYSLFAKIESGEDLLWVSTEHTPVITNNNPTSDIEMRLFRTSPSTDSSSSYNYVAPVAFEGTEFNLVSVNGKFVNGSYTATFTDGKVQAKFCNGMGGDYTYKNNVVTAPTMISTMMFCQSPDGLMDAEQVFGKIVSEGAKVTITEKILELSAGENKMIFQAK